MNLLEYLSSDNLQGYHVVIDFYWVSKKGLRRDDEYSFDGYFSDIVEISKEYEFYSDLQLGDNVYPDSWCCYWIQDDDYKYIHIVYRCYGNNVYDLISSINPCQKSANVLK